MRFLRKTEEEYVWRAKSVNEQIDNDEASVSNMPGTSVCPGTEFHHERELGHLNKRMGDVLGAAGVPKLLRSSSRAAYRLDQ